MLDRPNISVKANVMTELEIRKMRAADWNQVRAIYLEGIYVEPRERGTGIGSRCMSQLGQTLLAHTDSLCVFVNEQSPRARSFFERTGFKLRSHYDTIFLQQKTG